MSNTKTVMGQAANTLTTPLNVEDVFSTYLYGGNGTSQTITNGIDLDGEGGWLWIKERNNPTPHQTFNTEVGLSGPGSRLITSDNNRPLNSTRYISSFNSDGFSIGDENDINRSTGDYASWTFRKAPKFFTCLTYSGTGSTQNISHDLGSVPGMIIAKRTDSTGSWITYHRSLGNDKYLLLQETNAAATGAAIWDSTTPTDSVFTVGALSGLNLSGATYVAYLFAHNDGDGGFNGGDIIKCGSYTGNGSTDGPEIDLGFEPQWLLYKNANGTDNWEVADVMRGMPADGSTTRMRILRPNTSAAEFSDNETEPKPTGFKITNSGGNNNDNGSTYIYMAIRRGTKVPESGAEVFSPVTYSGTSSTQVVGSSSQNPLDMTLTMSRNQTFDNFSMSRLTGATVGLKPNATDAKTTGFSAQGFDLMYGQELTDDLLTKNRSGYTYSTQHFSRAPKFFDAVTYTGNGVQGRNITHNLGVAPDMMWVKNRDRTSGSNWVVYVSGITHLSTYGSDPDSRGDNPSSLFLNKTDEANFSMSGNWDHTHPTDTTFRVGDTYHTNENTKNIIAYLFASLPGISKVGSYTGNGSSSGQNIDCGFTTGARFILLKRTDGTSNWIVLDTERGITTGNDPYLKLDVTDAETTNPFVDPYSSGFKLQGTIFNGSGENYIFYAIA